MFKWGFAFTVLLCTQVYANGFSQRSKIDLDLERVTLKKALTVLEQKSDVRLMYSEDILPNVSVSLKGKNVLVLDALRQLLQNTNLSFREFRDGLVVIISPERVRIADIIIRGKVRDQDGAPLAGVSIQLKGTNIGLSSDNNGDYTIEVPESGILEFSYSGFITKEIPVKGKTTIDVTMELDSKRLNEVVVTGYNKEKKKDIIGSVSIVKTEDLVATPTSNITSQLQGRSAGVTVSSDGSLNGAAKVRIRGFGSFSGSEPLYVIDGVPVSGTRSTTTSSAIDNLNPSDIESMQILKDAAAASIYGARAANGVVIITTKRGKSGNIKVSFDSYIGQDYVSHRDFPDLLDAKGLGDLYWKQMQGAYEATGNPAYQPGGASWTHSQYGSGPEPVIPEYILVNYNGTRYGGTALEAMRNNNPQFFQFLTDPQNYNFYTHQIVKSGNTNWFKEVYNPAYIGSAQLGISGGSQKGNYAISMNYFSRTNVATKYNDLTRYSFRVNTNFIVSDRLRVGNNMQVYFNQEKGNATGLQSLWFLSPLIPVYDIMGNPASSAAPQTVTINYRNPVTQAYRNRFDRNSNIGVFGNAFAELDIFKDLKARTSIGINYSSRRLKDLSQMTVEHSENDAVNILENAANFTSNLTWTNTLNYSKIFNEIHDFKILVGSEAIKSYGENLSAARTNLELTMEDNPNFQILDAAVGPQTNKGNFYNNTLYSLFTRLDYALNEKYLFNFTLRRDASSKFSKNNRVGYFPALAVGWRLSSEPFMKNVEFVNDLKFRASYGIIGNELGLPPDNQYNLYVSDLGQGYPISGSNSSFTNSLTLGRVGNANAKWEENRTLNIGFDLTVLDNSLDFTVEFYRKQTKDLLVQNQPASTGVEAVQPYLNAGDMENNGIDLGLTKRGKIGGDWKYDVGFTFSTYRNKVTRVLDNPSAVIFGGEVTPAGTPSSRGNTSITKVGYPIASYYGYKLDGFFNSQREVDEFNAAYNPTGTTTPWIPPAVGRWRIKDVNEDGVINAMDRTIIGSPHPDFQTSVNFTLSYKNFDLNAFVFVNKGGQLFNLNRLADFSRTAKTLYESWTPELGDKAKLPKLNLLDTYSSAFYSDYFLEDASYARLKTVRLGYSFPKPFLKRYKLDNLRLYLQAQNLLTIKNRNTSALDPDAALSGTADTYMGAIINNIPTPKQVLFGLSLGF